jgi:hypothetical protein
MRSETWNLIEFSGFKAAKRAMKAIISEINE